MSTKSKTAAYREQLIKLSDEILGNAAAAEDVTCTPTGGQADGGLSNAPMHLADLGTDASMQETSAILLENERYLLGEIDGAMKRLDNDQYGRCETCGAQIGEERLEAIPYARNCMDCAQQEDKDWQNGAGTRYDETNNAFAHDDKLTDRPDFGDERGGVAYSNDDVEDEDAADIHAAGTPGGGTAIGGLGGTNIGRGNPRGGDLERATGRGDFDADEQRKVDPLSPLADRSGGAIDGTPKRKRAK